MQDRRFGGSAGSRDGRDLDELFHGNHHAPTGQSMTPEQERKMKGIRKSILDRLTDRKVQADLKPKDGVKVAQVLIVIVDVIYTVAETDLIVKQRIDAIEADVITVKGFKEKSEDGVAAFVVQEGDIKTPWVRERMKKRTAPSDLLGRMQEIGLQLYAMCDTLPIDFTLGLAGVLHRLTTGDWRPTLARSLAGVLNPEKPGRRPTPGTPGKADKREDREIASAERAVQRAGGVLAADLYGAVILSFYHHLRRFRPAFVVVARDDGRRFVMLAEHARGRALPDSYRILDLEPAERAIRDAPYPPDPRSATCAELANRCQYLDASGKLKPAPIYALPATS